MGAATAVRQKATRAGVTGISDPEKIHDATYRANTHVHMFAGKEPTPELPKFSWGLGTLTKAEYDAWWEEYEARQER